MPKMPTSKFRIGRFNTQQLGERIIIFGEGGSGKSTLASLAPSPVFVPLSDGAREISVKGENLPVVEGIETFADFRDALATPNLFDDYRTIVIDDGTELESLAIGHVVGNYKTDTGKPVNSIEGFGYGKGFTYLQEVMRLLKADFDQLVYQDKHVVLICHMALTKVGSADEYDFIQAGPRLHHSSTGKVSIRDDFYGWATQVVHIDFIDKKVIPDADKKDSSVGRVLAEQTRAIFTEKQAQYLRKSRNLNRSKKPLPAVISFESSEDDSFWKFIEGDE